ncbi:MAG: hypothetical protein [Microviridae sp.]|nr:MAG: hypothetical protein [Microviridae sp.]
MKHSSPTPYLWTEWSRYHPNRIGCSTSTSKSVQRDHSHSMQHRASLITSKTTTSSVPAPGGDSFSGNRLMHKYMTDARVI